MENGFIYWQATFTPILPVYAWPDGRTNAKDNGGDPGAQIKPQKPQPNILSFTVRLLMKPLSGAVGAPLIHIPRGEI
jgi:hypothetical protein